MSQHFTNAQIVYVFLWYFTLAIQQLFISINLFFQAFWRYVSYMIFKLNVINSNRIESFFKDQEINFRFGSVGRTIFLIAVYSDLAALTKLYMQPGIYL